MPAAAARRRRKAGAPPSRAEGRLRGRRKPAVQHSLEHRILLTATLCLLAFGAVMVYSASSATTVVQGHGYGSGYLPKDVGYGGRGLIEVRRVARAGLER